MITAGRAAVAGVLAVTLDCSGLLRADDLGLPPGAVAPRALPVADDIRPIDQPDVEAYRIRAQVPRANQSPRQSTAQWSNSSTGTAVSETDTAWKLRWRKPDGVAQAFASDPQPLTAARAVVWNQSDGGLGTASYPVRAAAQLAPVDPFEEPYPGQPVARQDTNQTAPADRSRLNTQPPAAAEDPFDALPNATPQPRVPANPLLDSPSPDQPALPALPMEERDLPPVPPPNMGVPDQSTTRGPSDVPCDRIYNGRNCCAEDITCKKAHDFVAQQKITNILLDITPSFTNTDSAIPTEVRRESELARAPSRVWKDRLGNVVGEGHFKDYRNGLIHIVDENSKVSELVFNDLSDDDVCFVTAWWSLPTECSLVPESYQPRNWLAQTYTWKASALCHKPLYFEEVALERYGHSVGPIKQPFVSGAHFFGSLIALPYQMGIHPPNECQYALGYYRPGSCAPWLLPPVPISVRGAMATAGAYVGGIYLIP